MQTAEEEMRRMSNQVRFIRAVRSGELDMTRKAAVIIAALDADGYDRMVPPKAAKVGAWPSGLLGGAGGGAHACFCRGVLLGLSSEAPLLRADVENASYLI